MRQPAFLHDRVFWIALCLMALSLTQVGLFVQNRRVLTEHHAALTQLCDDRSSLDLALVQPELTFWRAQLAFASSPRDRQLIDRRIANLQVAHEELSSTPFCDSVR